LAIKDSLQNMGVVGGGQDGSLLSKPDQLLSLVAATPCTRSANSLGLVA
jgi:hypothetical protein